MRGPSEKARTLTTPVLRRNIGASLALATLVACTAEAPPPRANAYALAGPSASPTAPALIARPDAPPSYQAVDAPFLAHVPPGASWSIGTTRAGYLLGGARLDPGPGLALRPVAIARRATYGVSTLVAALGRAARKVAERYPGSVLYVGDLGLEHGGPLAPHRSHTSGRDVDLSFYIDAPDGRPNELGGMNVVDADGRVAGGGTFAAPRNWALIDALLRDPAIQVQWVFVASQVEALLLEAARAAGADPLVVERAKIVMQEPGDSSPHADHFHVRVYCGRDERLQGCLDAPPFHPWVDDHRAAVDAWAEGLIPFLSDPRGAAGEEFRFALERLVRAHARAALPHLERLLTNPDLATRALVQDAVDFLTGRRTPEAWARWRPDDIGD